MQFVNRHAESPRFGDHPPHQRRGLVGSLAGAPLGADFPYERSCALAQFDEPVGLELAIGLDDGRGIHAQTGRQLAHRGEGIAGTKIPGGNGDAHARGDLGIERCGATWVDMVEHDGYCIIVPIQYNTARFPASP